MGLSSMFAHRFPILVSIWHTAVGLTGTLGTPRRGGASSEKNPKQVPVTRPSQRWEPRDQT